MTEEKCNHIFSYWSYDQDGDGIPTNNEDIAVIRDCEKCDTEWCRNPVSNKWE